jgi:L-phenylalanine/L-methionine N-acetyltransferase
MTSREDGTVHEVAPIPDIVVPAGVQIRSARPSDTSSFLELYRSVAGERTWIRSETIPFDPRHYRRAFRRSWTDDRANLLALAGGRVVGSLGIEREKHPVTRHVATLGMFVDREWRRKGVGSALLAEALRWATEVGVEKVSLSVYPGNEAAIALYRRFRFVEEGRMVGYSRKSYGYEDEVIMARWVR